MAAKLPDQSPSTREASEGWLSTLWSEAGAVMSLMLDFSFKRFLTPRLIRILYCVSLLIAAISAVTWMTSGFGISFFRGMITLITGPIAFFIYAIIARVTMELVLVIFRIAENIERLPTAKEPLVNPPPH